MPSLFIVWFLINVFGEGGRYERSKSVNRHATGFRPFIIFVFLRLGWTLLKDFFPMQHSNPDKRDVFQNPYCSLSLCGNSNITELFTHFTRSLLKGCECLYSRIIIRPFLVINNRWLFVGLKWFIDKKNSFEVFQLLKNTRKVQPVSLKKWVSVQPCGNKFQRNSWAAVLSVGCKTNSFPLVL